MSAQTWHAWLFNPAGLPWRLAAGLALLAVLAAADLRRHGRQAQRWREYLFLLAAVGMAMLYGLVNDQITVTISWEYFYHGKELQALLGPAEPPQAASLRLAAAKIALQASWWVGLAIGVLVLLANNPYGTLPRLPLRRLYRIMPALLLPAAIGATALGLAGAAGRLTSCHEDFALLVQAELWRPYRFMAVWGVHMGSYLGGASGAVGAVAYVLLARWRLRRGAVPAGAEEPGRPLA